MVEVEGRCAVSNLSTSRQLANLGLSDFFRSTTARPSKALGQHFLNDGRVLTRIVSTVGITPQDLILEIGPGLGVLTRRLVTSGARVLAVELDSHLAAMLPARLGNPPNLTVIEADARTLDLAPLVAPDTTYKVVGNLPYYAANPIIRRFLEASPQPKLMVVTLQEEVARTMTAVAGKMGFLSVAVQYYAVPTLVCTVPPRAFRPPPKVSSAVVLLEVRAGPAVQVADEQAFFSLVRAGFSAPRKQLRNSLAHGLGVPPTAVSGLLAGLDLDGQRRPATLSMDEWALIHEAWENRS